MMYIFIYKFDAIILFYLLYLTRLNLNLTAGKQVTSKEEIESIHWVAWTSTLGPEVNGIWAKYSDTNDINAVDTSYSNQVLVSGDDYGLVKLYRFPCVKKGI